MGQKLGKMTFKSTFINVNEVNSEHYILLSITKGKKDYPQCAIGDDPFPVLFGCQVQRHSLAFFIRFIPNIMLFPCFFHSPAPKGVLLAAASSDGQPSPGGRRLHAQHLGTNRLPTVKYFQVFPTFH